MQDVITQPIHVIANITNSTAIDTMPHAKQLPSVAMGGRWQRERKIFLQDHPLCKQCLKDDKLIPATEVDHTKPHNGDHGLMWNQHNWQALCKSCHSRKTVNEDGGFGRKKSP